MATIRFPDWADTMRQVFRAETTSQFVLHGNVHDFVVHETEAGPTSLPLQTYLADVLFAPFQTVLAYDRSRGIQALKGAKAFADYLRILDKYQGTSTAVDSDLGNLPRGPLQALDMLDRFLTAVATHGEKAGLPGSVAVVVDYAQFLAPRAESLQLSGENGAVLIKLLRWAQDPALQGSRVLTCLVAENLLDLHDSIVQSAYSAKVRIALPEVAELESYLKLLSTQESEFARLCPVPIDVLAKRMVGLNRVQVKNVLLRALRNNTVVTPEYLTQLRKETIEKEAAGKLVFIESKLTLDNASGHVQAKKWLREDAKLMLRGATGAVPMGYLLAGRIGTGKTFLVQCFAGECGIPFVELRNFRERWVGSTEGNLEKVFHILRALGQVVVFVDEADQATGKRGGGDGDSGLSGRIYAMLAKEMSDTRNRGRIVWIFATSRPDMVEVDLKRQGRLDVHIPLFPPDDPAERKQLFVGMARKLKLPLTEADLPEMPFTQPIGGNEIEGLLVRAYRQFELQNGEPNARSLKEIFAAVVADFKPSAHTAAMELMDLLAVKECTDACFLPARFADLSPETVDRRIAELQVELG